MRYTYRIVKQVWITKADGEKEPFDPHKLDISLSHAGASSDARAKIVSRIGDLLEDGMRTEDIYKGAFEMLRRSSAPA